MGGGEGGGNPFNIRNRNAQFRNNNLCFFTMYQCICTCTDRKGDFILRKMCMKTSLVLIVNLCKISEAPYETGRYNL